MNEEKTVTETKNIWETIQNIPTTLIFWFIFLSMIFVFLRPLGIPIKASDQTRSYVNELKSLTDGNVVMIGIDAGVYSGTEIGGSFIATMKYLNTRDVRIIIWGTNYATDVAYDQWVKPHFKDLAYGINYAYFGYIPGVEIPIAKLADDIPGLMATDYFGTPTSDLPVMDGIKNADDVDLVVTFDDWGCQQYWIGHWYSRYGTRILSGVLSMYLPGASAYFDAGQLQGLSGGVRGGAELEVIFGFPGKAVVSTDILNVEGIFVLFLLVLGNIGYNMTKRREK